MADLANRLQALKDALDALSPSDDINALEAQARELMADAKNTEFEADARAVFTQLAQQTNAPQTQSADDSAIRGLLRRARIRLDVATEDTDVDEAIDILAEALAVNPDHPDAHKLLQQAANYSTQHRMKVEGLTQRFGIDLDTTPSEDTPTSAAASQPIEPDLPAFQPAPQAQPLAPMPSEGDPLAEVSQAYYAGDYQRAVEAADRVLGNDPNNAQALDYKQKSEDNLMRGIVPDHRIPFEARIAYNRANSLVRAGNYDEAQTLYQEARDLAARASIMQWNDVEQALLDIQDLALAREMLNDGDRLLAADDWEGAVQKYEGALRVVPNDPLAEDRLELVRGVKEQFDQASVQLSMMSGSLMERAETLNRLLGSIAAIRKILPSSSRLQQLLAEVRSRNDGIKQQLLSQGNNILTRAETATTLEERSKLAQEAQSILSVVVNLDPTDPTANQALNRAQELTGTMESARQTMDQAAALIAQNTESELAQARTLLAGLREHAADNRYRAVVADLLASHLGYIESAIDRGDVLAAERWISISKEDPFRILGRRTELLALEDEIRKIKRGRMLQRFGFIGGIIILIGLVAFMTQDSWIGAVAPSPTPSYTPSQTATATLTPTLTLTPSHTPTLTLTPSITPTPTWTYTPSHTPTHTYTPSITPTETETPTLTPTPLFLCEVEVGNQALRVRERPALAAAFNATLQPRDRAIVLEQRVSDADGEIWYRIQAEKGDSIVAGWIQTFGVEPITPCPPL